MGRTPKTRETLRAQWADEPLSMERLRPPPGARPAKLDSMEKLAAVCELFCAGRTASEIKKELVKRYGPAGEMTREYVQNLVHRAANEGWLRFEPPAHLEHNQFIRETYDFLTDVRVLHTATMRDVATEAATVVLDLIMEKADQDEVHVGLAGGYSLRQVTGALARLLCGPIPYDALPRSVVFHSLVAGFDFFDPTTDPMTFFTFFVDEPALRIEPGFIGLRAPAIVKTRDIEQLKQIDGIKAAFEAASKIDIILTSGADWSDEHSQLRRFMSRNQPSMKKLEKEGCVGDVLWRPIGPNGPIETRTTIRAFTLFELSQIPDLIEKGVQVVLTLGPCGTCRKPKGHLLSTVLDNDRPLATHVITDSRTASELHMLRSTNP